MIPIYAVVSFLSYLFYKNAIYWEVIRDCYEAFAIASFFTLMCHYLEPTLHEQKNYFRQVTARNWIWPIPWMQKCTGGKERGILRVPRSGLTWFNIIWVGVFQYCAIRVIFTFVSLITQFFGRYCESSLNPAFAKIWVEVFEGVAVGFAMYFLIQFYVQLKADLAPYKPFLKIACIKLVIFFSFWQNVSLPFPWAVNVRGVNEQAQLVISFLTSGNGPLKPSKKIAYPDLNTGIPSMLLCVEMAIFAVLHIFAFPYKPYDISSPANAGDPRMKYHGFFYALFDAFNPWDIIKALARSARWVVVGYKKRETDESYNMKPGARLDGADDVYNGPSFAGNGELAMEFGAQKPRPSGGSEGKDGHDDMTGLLSHAQSNPSAPDLTQHPAYKPGSDSYGSYGSNGLERTPTVSNEYGSYPPSYMSGRDPSPYRYEPPRPMHSSHQGSGTGSSPVVVSPVIEQQSHMGPGGTAAHPFAGVGRPAYMSDEDYDHVNTGYQSTTAPGQAHGGEWNMWSGTPHR